MGSSLLLFLVLLFPVLLSLFWRSRKQTNLPPGPRPWPAIGNIPHLMLRQAVTGQRLHASLAAIAEDYGPLIYLRLGARELVVASSPSAAAQVLKTNDRVLCARYVPAAYRVPIYAEHSLIWHARCDDNWRSLRTIFRADLLSSPSLARHAPARERNAGEMARFLLSRAGKEVKIGKVIFITFFNMVGNIIFSRDVLSLEEGKGWFPELKSHMARMLELAVVPCIEDFFPGMTGGFDLDGLKHQVQTYLEKVYGIWDEIMMQRSEETQDKDFTKMLLDHGIRDNQLKALILDIFTAGSDTSAALAEWIMSELVRSPDVMKRVREELIQVMGPPPTGDQTIAIPEETHLARLTYLHACIKEALRLHPPAPLLLPRCAIDTCEIMSYTIPKNCTVMVNAWAIGRNPEIWKDPLSFSPERFLNCSVDYKGIDFEFVPFGGGMRACPGMSMGVRVVQLVVATMVHNFDWLLPGGKQPSELNMDEKLGLVLERKQPLVLIPKPLVG